MRRLVLVMLAFAAAAGMNTGSVAIQQRYALLTRCYGRRGWSIHSALVTPPWLGFLISLRGLQHHVRWRLPARVRPFGWPVLGLAALLWLAAYRELGGATVANGNFFGRGRQTPATGGVFRLLRNPMYDSYALALIGFALRRANAVYLLLASESFLLLNQLEARVENRPFTER